MMSLYSFLSAIELGLIYSLMVLGLFLSYRVLNIPDLTVDGSFTLGAAVAVVMTLSGHPILGLFAAILAGAAAGFLTAFLQTKMKIQPILAGIITMTALYSINLMVMDDKANVPITQQESIYTAFGSLVGKQAQGMVLSLLILILAGAAMVLFLKTPFGLSVRATGDNESMVRSSSINADLTKTAGLMGANACVALSGAMIAHYNCYAEVRMGIGMVVIGLASFIIGEIAVGIFVKRKGVLSGVVAAAVGSILYRLIIAQALELNFSSSSLKLITAIIVALAMSYPAICDSIALFRKKSQAKSGKEKMGGNLSC
ncbi:ABC transporter permease [Negativibacillus massiliensis]|uniref:ABC transporter permease n=2 Tax=Negativibacillus massiliensis TaxID=1871035 RepID=UPI00033CDD33|nr:ABC transporter permease [Negativibacillus massiliensis]CDA75911.1 aBC-type transporter integral membrane subunit [Clostridium sp. CAG:242]